GILPGVLLSAVLRLVFLLQRAAQPTFSVLGRRAETGEYRDLERHPECTAAPDVLVVRPNAGLVYFNADIVVDHVLDLVAGHKQPPRLVVLDLSFTEQIDPASVHALCALRDELAARGIELRLAEVHHRARERLILEGLEAAV